MSSQINANWPQSGAALTANVRTNFAYAKSEIEALQAVTPPGSNRQVVHNKDGVQTGSTILSVYDDVGVVLINEAQLLISSSIEANFTLERTDNNTTCYYVFTPEGTPSPTNVGWYCGMPANENNWDLMTWNGSAFQNILRANKSGAIQVFSITNSSPSNGEIWYESGDLFGRIGGVTKSLTASAGSGTPGGATTQLQFNTAGAFDGVAAFNVDKTNGTMGIGVTASSSAPLIAAFSRASAGTHIETHNLATANVSNSAGFKLKVRTSGAATDPDEALICLASWNPTDYATRTSIVKFQSRESSTIVYPMRFNGRRVEMGLGTPQGGSSTWGFSSDVTPGGYNLQVYDADTFGTLSNEKCSVWIERDFTSNDVPAGDPTIPVCLFVAHENSGSNTAYTHSIMGYALNSGTGDNDVVAVSGRARKIGAGPGDSAGVWGSAYNEVNQLGGIMGVEAHIYQNGIGWVTADYNDLGNKWAVGLHAAALCTKSPATAVISIDGTGNSLEYGAWNGILFTQNTFRQLGNTNYLANTTGINMTYAKPAIGARWGNNKHRYLDYTNSSPANGEFWYDSGFFVREGGATKSITNSAAYVSASAPGTTFAGQIWIDIS